MRPAVVIACVLALACAADAASSAVAALNCGVRDCCYSRSKAQRYCACADAFQRSDALAVCSTVRCAAGPPPGTCERLLAVPPTRAQQAAQQYASAPAPAAAEALAVAEADCICTKEYMPVCFAGKTFGNECEVRSARKSPYCANASCDASRHAAPARCAASCRARAELGSLGGSKHWSLLGSSHAKR